MDSQQWQLVESIFEQALQREPDDREEFLHDACAGDAEMLREVEQLLSHHGAAEGGGFLDDRPPKPLCPGE